jgi:hypothetical protein
MLGSLLVLSIITVTVCHWNGRSHLTKCLGGYFYGLYRFLKHGDWHVMHYERDDTTWSTLGNIGYQHQHWAGRTYPIMATMTNTWSSTALTHIGFLHASHNSAIFSSFTCPLPTKVSKYCHTPCGSQKSFDTLTSTWAHPNSALVPFSFVPNNFATLPKILGRYFSFDEFTGLHVDMQQYQQLMPTSSGLLT